MQLGIHSHIQDSDPNSMNNSAFAIPHPEHYPILSDPKPPIPMENTAPEQSKIHTQHLEPQNANYDGFSLPHREQNPTPLDSQSHIQHSEFNSVNTGVFSLPHPENLPTPMHNPQPSPIPSPMPSRSEPGDSSAFHDDENPLDVFGDPSVFATEGGSESQNGNMSGNQESIEFQTADHEAQTAQPLAGENAQAGTTEETQTQAQVYTPEETQTQAPTRRECGYGKYRDIESCQQAIERDPTDADAYFSLGVLMDDEEIVELPRLRITKKFAYIHALRHNPDLVAAYNNLAIFMEDDSSTEYVNNRSYTRRELLLEAIQKDSKYPHAFNNLGHILKVDETITIGEETYTKMDLYKQALTCDIHFAAAYNNIAGLLKDDETVTLPNGDVMDRKSLCVKALNFDSKLTVTYSNLASVMKDGDEPVMINGKAMARQNVCEMARQAQQDGGQDADASWLGAFGDEIGDADLASATWNM